MTFTTSLDSTTFSLPFDAGFGTVTRKCLDFATCALTEYSISSAPSRAIGSEISADGLTFYISNISSSYIPAELLADVDLLGFTPKYAITYEGVHISKRLIEYPIPTRDLKDMASSVGRGYFIPLSQLYTKIQGISGINATINGIPDINIFFTAEGNEVISLSDYWNDMRYLKGLVYSFSGSTLNLVTVNSGGGGSATEFVGNQEYVYSDNYPCFANTLLENNNFPEYSKEYIEIPSSYYTYEGDSNPQDPPLEVGEFPKTGSIMYGNSGALTKQFKITIYEEGGIKEVIEGTFGYAHSLVELTGGNSFIETQGLEHQLIESLKTQKSKMADLGSTFPNLVAYTQQLVSGTTAGYENITAGWVNPVVWRCVKVTVSEYIYEPITLPSNSFKLISDDGTISPEKVVLPPSYIGLLTNSSRVLSKIVTRGIELRRFQDESTLASNNNSLFAYKALQLLSNTISNMNTPIIPEAITALWVISKFRLESFLYRRVPIVEAKIFSYAPYSAFYKDEQFITSFQTIPVKRSDIGLGGDDFVMLAVPDPSWKPSIMQTGEYFYSKSIAVQGNPSWNPFTRNYFQSNPIFLYTGSEVETTITYTPLPSFNTTERVNDYTFQTNLTGLINKTNIGKGTYYSLLGIESLVGATNDTYSTIPDVSPSIPSLNTDSQIDTDRFVQYVKTRSAQNQGFKDGKFFYSSNIVSGRPPAAIVATKPIDLAENRDASVVPDFFTYISSSIQSSNYLKTYSNVLTNKIDELEVSAKNYLIEQILLGGSKLKLTLSDKDSSIEPNGIISGANIPPGQWLITEVTKKTFKKPDIGLETVVIASELKNVTITKRTVDKWNRVARLSTLNKSGGIEVDIADVSKDFEDITGAFQDGGFGRFITQNSPGILPEIVINAIKGVQ
ncbi:MAG: hypothetical protein CV045_10050 [Cyanobacteria bacterium M5B4]|nr:MAG: hypothetical protein CV045_10050 [Cyanobacteria bacterium M5B4]